MSFRLCLSVCMINIGHFERDGDGINGIDILPGLFLFILLEYGPGLLQADGMLPCRLCLQLFAECFHLREIFAQPLAPFVIAGKTRVTTPPGDRETFARSKH